MVWRDPGARWALGLAPAAWSEAQAEVKAITKWFPRPAFFAARRPPIRVRCRLARAPGGARDVKAMPPGENALAYQSYN